MIFAFYRYFLVPFGLLLLPVAALVNRKLAAGLRLRRQKPPTMNFSQPPLWIHAASGEFEYAKSVIREWKLRHPETPVLVTYFSPTYARNVENFPGVDLALPLPLDLPGPVLGFLRKYKPALLLISRTDLWPEMLHQTRRMGIPIHVFAYTQKPLTNSLRRWIARWRLNMADELHCVSDEDARATLALNVKCNVSKAGDTRYDQVRFRLDHPKKVQESIRPSADIPVLVAGSTWPTDEKVLLDGLSPLLKAGRLKLILVPHEPEVSHLEQIKARLEREQIGHALFSKGETWTDRSVLLVDVVGWLAELYALGDLALVGGSFSKSVHSVMEALGAGLPTIVGPYHLNNREAVEFQNVDLKGVPAVQVVVDADSLHAAVLRYLDADLESAHAALLHSFNSRLGASRLLVSRLI